MEKNLSSKHIENLYFINTKNDKKFKIEDISFNFRKNKKMVNILTEKKERKQESLDKIRNNKNIVCIGRKK